MILTVTRVEKVKANWRDGKPYNCAQSVIVAFSEECNLSEELAVRIGTNLGWGMHMGSTCGAINGALIALGGMGYGKDETLHLLQTMREKHGCTDCAGLIRQAREQGTTRQRHCAKMIYECISSVEDITQQKGSNT